MKYKISKEELLSLCRLMFDASVDNFMDLKEQTCDQVLESFLADKKTLHEGTLVSMDPVSQWPQAVYTLTADGSFTANPLVNPTIIASG